jgi:hypothetical protein
MNQFRRLAAAAAAIALLAGAAGAGAATFEISSRDGPGIGFNDPTPVPPVGGNPGKTLGEQRMNIYKYVAGLWGKALDSNVTITVNAGWEPLACTATTGVLGSAGPHNLWHDFPGGKPGTWYPAALANKLAGVNLAAAQADDGTGYGNVDIKTQFNINLGQPGCIDGYPFYLGLDGKGGNAASDFVEVLLHELGHGLGFGVNGTDTYTGWRLDPSGVNAVAQGGLPTVWEGFMYDNTAGKTWLDMTNEERAASAVNPLQLAWRSPGTLAAAKSMLAHVPTLKVTTPAPAGAGLYRYNIANFGPVVATGAGFGNLAAISLNGTNAGCAAFDGPTTAGVAGKVVIIDRGGCDFVVKAKNAQVAGAVGVVIADNRPESAPGLGGSDATVTIPTVSVSQNDGVTLKAVAAAAPRYGSRVKPGLATTAFTTDPVQLAGADAAGRPLLYTPVTFTYGSSVSHWDVTALPNLLMEPNINLDLTTSLVPPKDLTKPLLSDLGW